MKFKIFGKGGIFFFFSTVILGSGATGVMIIKEELEMKSHVTSSYGSVGKLWGKRLAVLLAAKPEEQ